MRSTKPRLVSALAVLNTCVLIAGLAGALMHDSHQPEPPSDAARAEPAAKTPPTDAAETPAGAPTADPPSKIDLSPSGVAKAAMTTAEQSSRFAISLEFTDQSWANSSAPVRSASARGAVDGDRLILSMEAEDFLNPQNEWRGYEARPPIGVAHAWRAAKRNDSRLTVTRIGSVLWMCGFAFGNVCEEFRDWEPQVERLWDTEAPARSTAALTVMPLAHIQSLSGAVEVEEVGPAEVRGVFVHHVRGTLTVGRALAAQPPGNERNLRWWYAALNLGNTGIDHVRDELFPFEAWIDDDGIVRRATVSLAVSPRDYVPDHGVSLMSLLNTGEADAVAKVTTELYDIGSPVDLTPPDGARPYPPPPVSVDPRYTGELDAEEMMKEWQEILDAQG